MIIQYITYINHTDTVVPTTDNKPIIYIYKLICNIDTDLLNSNYLWIDLPNISVTKINVPL
jgi:hypothetical protein